MALSPRDSFRPPALYSDERVPLMVAPEVRKRLNALLLTPAFVGSGVGYSAFIDRACEHAETAVAQGQAEAADEHRL